MIDIRIFTDRVRVYSDNTLYLEILQSNLLNEFDISNLDITTYDSVIVFKGCGCRLFALINWLTAYAHEYVMR